MSTLLASNSRVSKAALLGWAQTQHRCVHPECLPEASKTSSGRLDRRYAPCRSMSAGRLVRSPRRYGQRTLDIGRREECKAKIDPTVGHRRSLPEVFVSSEHHYRLLCTMVLQGYAFWMSIVAVQISDTILMLEKKGKLELGVMRRVAKKAKCLAGRK